MEGWLGELSTGGEFVGGMEGLPVSLDYDACLELGGWCIGVQVVKGGTWVNVTLHPARAIHEACPAGG